MYQRKGEPEYGTISLYSEGKYHRIRDRRCRAAGNVAGCNFSGGEKKAPASTMSRSFARMFNQAGGIWQNILKNMRTRFPLIARQ